MIDEKKRMDIDRFFAQPNEFIFIEPDKIEIDISKLERGTHEGKVKVVRGGKTFWRKQRVGTKDKPKDEKTAGFNVGDAIKFMGENRTITKINPSNGNITLNTGLTYTAGAISKYSQRISEKKVVSEVKPKPKPKPVPKVELKVESKLKPKPEPKDIPKVEPKPKSVKSEMITGTLKDGALNQKERKEASENLTAFLDDVEAEEEKGLSQYASVRQAAKVYTMGYSWDLNSYLIADKKKGFDFIGHGLKDIDDEEKSVLNSSVKLLDEFLERAPKVKTTTYRSMRWDPENPVEKKNSETFISSLEEGGIIESKAYSSTTVSRTKLKEFLSNARRGEITASIEYETTGVYLNGESKYPDQEELLIARNVKYEIVSVKSNKNKDHYNVKLREVGLNG